MAVIWPWLAAVGLGVFHGLNPGMGWLFAVSNGLQAGRVQAVWAALVPLAVGHCLAMATILVPAALLESLNIDQTLLQSVAALALIAFGGYKFMRPAHPRVVARVGPKRLTLWSFLMATAHGAGLMLLPVFFAVSAHAGPGSGPGPGPGHAAMMMWPDSLSLALLMVLLHTAAMVMAAGAVAWLVYRYLGLRLLRAAWLNTDRIWAGALVAVGALALLALWV